MNMLTESSTGELDLVMTGLKNSAYSVLDKIPPNRNFVYVDIPMHLNVGDLLIRWGTEVVLESAGLVPSMRLTVRDYKRYMNMISPSDIILMHGGGNMNAIWQDHEDLRIHMLKSFPENKIIILPQTIYYGDHEKGRKALQPYNDHPDCFIFARDERSLAYVQENSNVPCMLCPDMAHALWRRENEIFPVTDGERYIRFARRDKESRQIMKMNGAIDWDDIVGPVHASTSKLIFAGTKFAPNNLIRKMFYDFWDLQERLILMKAIKVFSQAATIETDRLHAIILGCLLGKNVIYHDNSYGKLSGYCDTWLKSVVTRSE